MRRIVLLGVSISLIILFLIYYMYIDNGFSVNVEKEDSSLSVDYEKIKLDYEFIDWIEDNYGRNVLKKLEKEINENAYSIGSWYDLTGNSLNTLKLLYSGKLDNVKVINNSLDVAKISFVGDVSLADNFEIMPYYDSRGKKVYGILSEEVVELMNLADVMVSNNEFTISDRGTKMSGKTYTFRASPERVKIYEEMGVDLVTLANNHVYDFGRDAFLDTLDILRKNNLPYIGAGRNIEEARKPYYFIVNGYKIAFVNATRAEKHILTPEATVSNPGVFRAYDPTMFMETIKLAKEDSDYVIALIHWGWEDHHELEEVQVTTGKQYIESGADIIIGSHAHTLQGVEFYKGKPIIYNIGDFIFNRETKDTVIFTIQMNRKGELEYYFTPCKQDNYKTSLLDGKERLSVLDDIEGWSINALIDSNGKIEEKS